MRTKYIDEDKEIIQNIINENMELKKTEDLYKRIIEKENAINESEWKNDINISIIEKEGERECTEK